MQMGGTALRVDPRVLSLRRLLLGVPPASEMSGSVARNLGAWFWLHRFRASELRFSGSYMAFVLLH